MKKLLFSLCAIVMVLLGACKKEGLITYDNKVSKNSIYFPIAQSVNNQQFISFGYAKSTVKDSVVKLVVRAIGAPVDYDRPYNLSIADSSTMKANIDYEIINPTMIKAGKVADTLKIKLIRTSSIKTKASLLYMNLKPNENFTNDYLASVATRMAIKVDDIAGAPLFWLKDDITSYNYTIGFLGAFSTLKFQLLITTYNLNVDELIQPNFYLTGGNFRRVNGWANGLKVYLSQMELAGTPVYEADGVTLMKMGPNAR